MCVHVRTLIKFVSLSKYYIFLVSKVYYAKKDNTPLKVYFKNYKLQLLRIAKDKQSCIIAKVKQ